MLYEVKMHGHILGKAYLKKTEEKPEAVTMTLGFFHIDYGPKRSV